jgi:hypothetical protein
MARSNSYAVGNTPPEVVWTVVRGDTASFRVYATDDLKLPLVISDWTIKMDIQRADSIILNLFPEQAPSDNDGEFTVSLTSSESEELETGDIFDIQLSDDSRVWTIAKGSMVIIEDVTE